MAAEIKNPALFFDLHGNGSVWEVDTLGHERFLVEYAIDLMRNGRVSNRLLRIADGTGLTVGERISNPKLCKRNPRTI